MTGTGVTRIDTIFLNDGALQTLSQTGLLYGQQPQVDHLPLMVALNADRYSDTVNMLEKPAGLVLPDLSKMTKVQREDFKHNLDVRFDELFCKVEDRFKLAIDNKDIEAANTIWHTLC